MIIIHQYLKSNSTLSSDGLALSEVLIKRCPFRGVGVPLAMERGKLKIDRFYRDMEIMMTITDDIPSRVHIIFLTQQLNYLC